MVELYRQMLFVSKMYLQLGTITPVFKDKYIEVHAFWVEVINNGATKNWNLFVCVYTHSVCLILNQINTPL